MFAACPASSYRTKLKDLQNNRMDFPNPVKTSHEGISFNLSDMFQNAYYYNNFTLKDNAMRMGIDELNIYFSVELFTPTEVSVFRYAFEESNPDDLQTVQEYYLFKRAESLGIAFVSENDPLPKQVGVPGRISVVRGKNYDYSDSNSDYFISTIKVDDNFYVFQLIGKSGSMDYLYDDFLDILKSVY